MTSTHQPVTVIVPVYGDWESLQECTKSLIKHVDTDLHSVVFVNDCGPDADVIEKNLIRLIKNEKGFLYKRNKKNLGFVQNCNKAVEELGNSNDVLLLNSDTKVTKGFLDEMQAVLYADKKHGAVSPRSNNATICTVPLSAIKQRGIEMEESYKLFSAHKDEFPVYNVVPTGHGFCMMIRRDLIEKYGLFDTVFGKGYGEEVDFCQRIKKKGFLCVLSNKSYVFHLEARSFSLEAKAKLLETNNIIIRERYPTYKQQVTNYIKEALEFEARIYKHTTLHPSASPIENAKAFVNRHNSLKKFIKMILRKK